MVDPINAKNREQATVALLRAAGFYRGLVNAITERHPEVVREIMDEGESDSRWVASEAADTTIKEWAELLEVRDLD